MKDDEKLTVRKLIEELQKYPPDAEIGYVDVSSAGCGLITSWINEHGLVEIGN